MDTYWLSKNFTIAWAVVILVVLAMIFSPKIFRYCFKQFIYINI